MKTEASSPWIVPVTLLGVAVLLAVLAVPLIRRRVPPNPLYGVRTRKAFASESNWYAINAFGGGALLTAAGQVAACALALATWPPRSAELAAILAVGAIVVPVGVWLLRIHRFSRHLP